ncbi:MAG TPA: CzcE family metal-binding protein [Janthinobacterium sp.]|nr:CzcE family metal-binding protein [Janthinobacterium sp.]
MLPLTVGASLALLASSAFAMGPTGTKADYGFAAAPGSADGEITVTPQTKWVNVDDGQTVKFSVDNKTFTWHFSTFQNPPVLNLSVIAPSDVNVGNVKVYIAPDPLYLN